MKTEKTTIVGHRGCGCSQVGGTSIYPENSLFSFKKAVDLKIDGIELDVWLTNDNEVVVIHGTNDGLIGHTLLYGEEMKGKYIEELTRKEIQSFHFKEPWILRKGKNYYIGNSNESIKFSILNENEKLEKIRDYDEFDSMYLNVEENDEIEKIINESFFNNCLTEKNNDVESDEKKREKEKKFYKEFGIDDNIEEEEFIKNIECSYCKFIYTNYLSKRTFEFKRKQVIFKFISMFYHVPLLKDILNIFKNKLTYDIELKGTKENIGLYILDILENYKGLKFKFSSFNWILQDNQIKKKLFKNKNMQKMDYSSYPYYNVEKIDLLKPLRNNKLNIPLALLFTNNEVMPNINSILCSMKYYNAEWAHFPCSLNKQSIILNCNRKDKIISVDYLVKVLHKNNKKIMIYWGAEDKDQDDDLMCYIKLNVDSICPNDIALAKEVMQKEKYINSKINEVSNNNIVNDLDTNSFLEKDEKTPLCIY
ncbi:glycerophosphodiester phosphodiesterase, putative [Plasmodium gallinaceum]|uniref:Glycerophosphodiester phosphodiesterase, putative n=1 Tax=Plasmodium gallinaceum TaxID=5849 RepID=A0A1J1GTF9_PLAGA|nr:glycerophosphodiester phosphodiesterase, putative [Plasmodium gallinaceum]CRG95585.1 glycerophosphodiester phosphodiesterase, putative [Plasmodium gallinaceum]